jgi:UDP-glucuronate 4-epimerase
MNKDKPIYIVTGCVRFIGYHVCESLLKKNYTVVGINNLKGYYDIDLKPSRLKNLNKKNK